MALTDKRKNSGDVEDLGLYFATDEHVFGEVVTHELKFVS